MIDRIGVQPVVVSPRPSATYQSYRVVEVVDGQEQKPSLAVGCVNDLSIDGNVNFIHWNGTAALFRVQKAREGQFIQIGETGGSSFVDDGSA